MDSPKQCGSITVGAHFTMSGRLLQGVGYRTVFYPVGQAASEYFHCALLTVIPLRSTPGKTLFPSLLLHGEAYAETFLEENIYLAGLEYE